MPAFPRIHQRKFGLWIKLLKRGSKLSLSHGAKFHSEGASVGSITRILQNRVTDDGTFNVIVARVDETTYVCCDRSDDSNPSSQSRRGSINYMLRCPMIIPDRVGTPT